MLMFKKWSELPFLLRTCVHICVKQRSMQFCVVNNSHKEKMINYKLKRVFTLTKQHDINIPLSPSSSTVLCSYPPSPISSLTISDFVYLETTGGYTVSREYAQESAGQMHGSDFCSCRRAHLKQSVT